MRKLETGLASVSVEENIYRLGNGKSNIMDIIALLKIYNGKINTTGAVELLDWNTDEIKKSILQIQLICYSGTWI